MMQHDNTQLSLSLSQCDTSKLRQPLVDTKSSEQIGLSVFGNVFRGLSSDSGFGQEETGLERERENRQRKKIGGHVRE